MKKFTMIFCSILIGVMLGYSWAYHHYMPKIRALEACLGTYQEYFAADIEPFYVGAVPHKSSKKYETKF